MSDVATAPFPVSATFAATGAVCTVTFDQPLTPGSSAVPNWQVKANLGAGVRRFIPLGPPAIFGSQVQWAGSNVGPSLGPNVVDYSATIPDVTALVGGLPAAAFSAFPVTILP